MTSFDSRGAMGALRRLALALAASAVLAGPAAAAPLDDMRRFVEAGQFEPAYKLAMANRQLIGDAHFDFLYGVAAVNVGRVPEGLLALERHLAVVPANDRARLELARGYFLIGEYARARSEFEFVLRYDPPAGVKATIARFLEAMQLRDTGERRGTARLYLELGGGHDSNVNGGTFRDELQFVFGNVSLAGSPSQAVADDFAQVSLGGQQVLRVTNRLSVFAGVDADHRENGSHREFNLSTLGGHVGLTQLAAGAIYRLTLSGNTLLVGSNRYRDTRSLGLEATFTPSAEWQLMLFGQYSEWRHQGEDQVRDARGVTLGGMATRSFAGPAALAAGVRLSVSQEDNQRLRQDLDREVPLLRLFASGNLTEGLRVTAGLTGTRQRYGAADIGFGTVREDASAHFDLVLNWAVTPRWSVRAEYLAYLNHSNQDLYDGKRQSLALKTRVQY